MNVFIHVGMFLAVIIVFFYGVINAIKLNIVLYRIKNILQQSSVIKSNIDFFKWNQEKLNNRKRSNIDLDLDAIGDDRTELKTKIDEYYLLIEKKNKALITFFILLLIEMALMLSLSS